MQITMHSPVPLPGTKAKTRREEKERLQTTSASTGNAANADLVQQLSRLLGAALSTQQNAGNGGSVDWGIDDNRPLNEQERR